MAPRRKPQAGDRVLYRSWTCPVPLSAVVERVNRPFVPGRMTLRIPLHGGDRLVSPRKYHPRPDPGCWSWPEPPVVP